MERLRGHKVIGVSAAARRTITAGRHTYSIPARHTATLRIRLTRTALKLLARFKTLPATLTITQTTAAGTATVASRWVRLRSAHARRALAAG
jgi:hypothetical protein